MVHSDQLCSEACSGCGRLMCDSCDVLYAGKHYCKACIGSIASPLRRFVPQKRSWALSLIDKLFSRWYSVALVSAGLFVLLVGILMVELPDKHASSYFQFHQDALGTLSSERSVITGISKTLSSVVIEAGAALILFGTYLFAKRFSLRWLLAGVITVAALASYPFLRIPGHPELTHEVTVNGPAMLSAGKVESISALLQPDAALGTLSPALLQELALHPGSVQAVRVWKHGDRGLQFHVEFADDITDAQRSTLTQFYDRYGVELVCHSHTSLATYPGSVWNKYEPEWLTRQNALQGTEF